MTHIRMLLVPCLALLLDACGEDEQATTTGSGDTAAATDAIALDTSGSDASTPDVVADVAAETVEDVAAETVEDVAAETVEDIAEEVASPTCGDHTLDPEGAGLWYADLAAFTAAVGDTTLLDFERRGDGQTPVTAGTAVPADEYVACCGVRLGLEATNPDVRLIWAGNAVGGFSVRAACANPDLPTCIGKPGIRVELVTPVDAVAGVYAGGIEAAVYDTAGGEVSTYALAGSGQNFVGYASGVRLGVATFVDFGGEDLAELRLRTCR